MRRKNQRAYSLPEVLRIGYWPGEYADRNRAVANQRLSGMQCTGGNGQRICNRRSIAETAMYRMKQLLGDSLTLRDYDGQVAKLHGHGACVEQDDKGWDARKRAYCLKIQPATGSFARNLIYSTKPIEMLKLII
uniref:Uncharacterized protein n=1 Tax=Klebsiella pneumoniae subsp. pneumoniae TaxID=72407 RepID=A0A7G3L399_KLEPN|nr:hypothetical protein ICEJAFMC_00134 [Klebsiella pneumoniae subsp. pneumoniae]